MMNVKSVSLWVFLEGRDRVFGVKHWAIGNTLPVTHSFIESCRVVCNDTGCIRLWEHSVNFNLVTLVMHNYGIFS